MRVIDRSSKDKSIGFLGFFRYEMDHIVRKDAPMMVFTSPAPRTISNGLVAKANNFGFDALGFQNFGDFV